MLEVILARDDDEFLIDQAGMCFPLLIFFFFFLWTTAFALDAELTLACLVSG